MSKMTDLSGQTFGRLTVLERDTAAKRTAWVCKCTCGRIKSIAASNLVGGESRSCGCASADAKRGIPIKHNDLTGQTYGRLTALEYISYDRWSWKCSCGAVVQARPSLVKAGDIRSCGCLQKELRRGDVSRTVQHAGGTCITKLRAIMSGAVVASNTSGCTGVRVKGNRYVARITYKRKEIYLGSYPTMDEAVAARKKAEAKYFAQAIEDYDNH